MPTTVLSLLISPVDSRNIPIVLPWWKRLGDVTVQTDDIKEINGANLMGQHSGFCVRVRKPNWWLCRAGYNLPGIPDTVLPPKSPFPNGGQLQARGLLDFGAPNPNFVAITGGTGDYKSASGEVKFLDDIHWELTVITP
jgi:hypothetical protein